MIMGAAIALFMLLLSTILYKFFISIFFYIIQIDCQWRLIRPNR